MFTPFAFQQPQLVTNGLVLYLDASDRTSYVSGSTVWRDLSAGNNGTLTNGPTFNSGNGGSIVFDGTNDYVNNGTSFANLTTQLTINVWGKINGNPIDGIFITYGEYDGTATSNFGFQIRNTATGNTRSLRLYAKASGQSYTTLDSNTNMWDNNTNNYSVTFNSGNVIFYKNGSIFATGSFGLNSLPVTTGPLYLGFLKGYPNYFNGSIYNIQVYNRALSAQEVLQNFNAQRQRFNI